ncbi:hypothetical protein IFM53868_05110 [Aspergillus udagawae]|uniref:Uncharacterized protein n=1 Tax=Aspergillus udagawae TaxID=91492 RepID=A0ABQ1ASP3_9EURO|nr:hypothetical protein IFM53868_05110 [Aspergillus udagawae]
MSCNNCHSSEKPSQSDSKAQGLTAHALRWMSAVLPEGSALLSSSCCWLPTVLDFVFAGSVTATGIQKLRPFFLAVSVLTLAWSISRQGLNKSNLRRAIICACLLAWSQYSQRAQPAKGHHSCH